MTEATSEEFDAYPGQGWGATAVAAAVTTGVFLLIWLIGGAPYLAAALGFAAVMAGLGWQVFGKDNGPSISRAQAAAHKWRNHFVSTDTLTPEAVALFKSLQTTVSQISACESAAELLDGAVALDDLADQAWQVVLDLSEYSRLRRTTARGSKAQAGEAAALRTLLDEKFASTRSHVATLQEVAKAMGEADKRLRAEQGRSKTDERQDRALEASRDSVVDLAASTARDAIAISDAEQLLRRLADSGPGRESQQ
ncbi:hypothetical protein [Catenulispora rubra]|uniref:hypothetical protein n=1 Tax=Catenulispora rubra TaxID=280293 RepID=UPI00189229C4|nr:hypothetical protein [Catenulispora rubra]